MVNTCIKVHMDLQADKSPIVVKGPFFPRVVNPGIECVKQCATQGFNLVKDSYLMKNQIASNLRYHQVNTSNLIH
jgi:hypothetical protein